MTGQTAFIIEDDPDLSHIFSLTLQQVGFQTEAILDGQRALTRLLLCVPDLILLDMHLPGINGADIWKVIQGDSRFEQTTTIVLSGDHLMANQLREEVDLVLLKPVEPKQLQRLAQRACDLHRKSGSHSALTDRSPLPVRPPSTVLPAQGEDSASVLAKLTRSRFTGDTAQSETE